eukprot:2700123-Rhodomonas_salina.3
MPGSALSMASICARSASSARLGLCRARTACSRAPSSANLACNSISNTSDASARSLHPQRQNRTEELEGEGRKRAEGWPTTVFKAIDTCAAESRGQRSPMRGLPDPPGAPWPRATAAPPSTPLSRHRPELLWPWASKPWQRTRQTESAASDSPTRTQNATAGSPCGESPFEESLPSVRLELATTCC